MPEKALVQLFVHCPDQNRGAPRFWLKFSQREQLGQQTGRLSHSHTHARAITECNCLATNRRIIICLLSRITDLVTDQSVRVAKIMGKQMVK